MPRRQSPRPPTMKSTISWLGSSICALVRRLGPNRMLTEAQPPGQSAPLPATEESDSSLPIQKRAQKSAAVDDNENLWASGFKTMPGPAIYCRRSHDADADRVTVRGSGER